MDERERRLVGAVRAAGVPRAEARRAAVIHRLEEKTVIVGECFVWVGAEQSSHYGVISIDGRMRTVHKLSYELHYGEVSLGLLVLHRCDNRRCWNPDHLFEGTHADNAQDMAAKGRCALQRGFEPLAGERNGRARLSGEAVMHIRTLLEDGFSQRQIAEHFGVRQNTISRIKTGATWT